MIALPRGILALLTAAVFGVFIYFHFHGAVSVAASAVQGSLKQPVIGVSPGNKYDVAVSNYRPSALPALPDLSAYTVENIAAQAPAFVPGKVVITQMAGLPGLREFIKKDGRVQRLRVTQMDVMPRAIVVQQGHYDFTHLYEEVRALTAEPVIEKSGDKYLLRLPILVAEGASLVISDKDTEELRLSQEKATLIANAGDLFIIRTKITGWNEKNNRPALFQDKTIYRPFLVNWSGARLNIAGSTLASLGYRKGKSYGLTYSSCDPCLAVRPNLARPTGTIVGSTFSDMYFGFYSYEADDVAIVGNVYKNNAVYGIDPHDRSRRLIIANNETYGSRKKHGIIISRNVNDSWIIGNNSHHNHGSGIMLDRTSENNVVANNISAHNEGDGITFFESQNNTLFGNQIYKNRLSGIRIRNSWNIKMVNDQVADNGGVPVVIYADRLEDTQKDRDFRQDPYTRKAEAEITGMLVKQPDSGPAFKIDSVGRLALSNVHLLSAGTIFSDHLFPDETQISRNMSLPGRQAVVKNAPL